MGDPGRARHRLPRPGGPFPRGWEGAAWCAVRPHPPHPRTARRRDEHSDLGPGERNGPPPAPGAPPPGPDVLLRPPPQPLGRGTNENTNRHRGPLPAQRHPHHQPPTPTRGAIADEPGNYPRATLDYLTPQEAFTQLIATTPPLWSVRRASSQPSSTPTSARC